MTEMPYPKPLTTFETGIHPEPCTVVPIIEEGRSALEKVRYRIYVYICCTNIKTIADM